MDSPIVPLTVATLNLRNNQDRWRERRELVVAQLLDVAPDLASLQEISFPIGQGRWLCRQLNVRLSGERDKPYHLRQARRRHPIHGYHEGVGILSRLPVRAHDSISLGYGGRVALRANVALADGQTLDFVTVHLHHVAYEKEARLEQVMRLTGWLNQEGRVPLQVIAGDFNETPDGPAIDQMKALYRSAYALVHRREPLATFPTALGGLDTDWSGCLDYIFVTPAIKVAAAGICCQKAAADDEWLYPSDHVGLYARLEIAALRIAHADF